MNQIIFQINNCLSAFKNIFTRKAKRHEHKNELNEISAAGGDEELSRQVSEFIEEYGTALRDLGK